MILVNTDHITGRNFKMLGYVQGYILHQTSTGGTAGTHGVTSLKAMGVGEDLVTQMVDQAREEARERMIGEAVELGADAIVSIQYHSSMVTPTACELVYSGTAVKFISRSAANSGL